MTPPAVFSRNYSNTSFWQVRVFANKFPAVTPGDSTSRQAEHGCFLSMGGMGFHEVVVETPVHNKPLMLMTDAEVATVLHAYRQRYDATTKIPFVKSVIIFKKHGPAAGTSLGHPHSQVVATAVAPRHMRMQYEVAIGYYDDNGRCLYSDLTLRELEVGARIIMDTERFAVFHPFASHRPFETWIMPKASQASFNQVSAEDVEHLAQVLRITLLKLYRGLDAPDFNFVIDSAPVGEECADFYRWHIRIIPRISEVAGFEIGPVMYINTALPEETAKFMRDLNV
jgi:UDPglucose--hexose-1-phosphate uridylyltransferase